MKRFAILFILAACNTGATEQPSPEPTTRVASADKFGTAITEPITPLGSIVKDPAAFKGKTVATSGKVTKVCTHQGCWMAIASDGSKDAMVRMHGHSFFVPPNSSTVGRTARIQGNIVLIKDGKECEDMEAVGAELQFDATGVELDPAS